LEDSLDLESVGCRLALADLYEKVDLPGEPWRHSTIAATPNAR
jgi:hypothetical protein